MRKVLVGAVALLAALLLATAFFSFPSKQSQPLAKEKSPASIRILSAGISDIGDFQAAVLLASAFGGLEDKATIFCLSSPIQKTAVILDFPQVPGSDEELPEKIKRRLLESGISPVRANLSEILLYENAVIISHSGAIPLEMLEMAERIKERNSRAIVLEILSRKTIDSNGSIGSLKRSPPPWFHIVRPAHEKGQDGVSEIVEKTIIPPQAPLAQPQIAAGNLTFTILLIPSEKPIAYCRAVLLPKEGAMAFSDSDALHPLKGRLRGPTELSVGEAGSFEFSFNDSSEVGRNLSLFVSASAGGEERFKKEIAGGVVGQGWTNKFLLSFPETGKYLVQVKDQFGRTHASAFVLVPSLEAKLISSEGSRYEFLLMLENEPLNGKVAVQLDGGEPRSYHSSKGKLVVWALPSPGNHTFTFNFSGSIAKYHINAAPAGFYAFLDSYMRLGLPAAVFLLAVFLLLKASRKDKYSITFPEVAAPKSEGCLEVSERDMALAWQEADKKLGGLGLLCYPHEIAFALEKRLGGKKVCAYSVFGVLRKLAAKGKFLEHGGAFIPKGKAGGFSAGELYAMRTIHECMVERGLKFERKRAIPIGKELEIVVFSGKKDALFGLGRRIRALVFPDQSELERFKESLSDGSVESNKIMLALQNSKIMLLAANNRHAIESILP